MLFSDLNSEKSKSNFNDKVCILCIILPDEINVFKNRIARKEI